MLGAIKTPAATIEGSPPSDPVDFVVVNNILGILKWQQQYVPIPMYKDTLPVVKGEEFTVLPRKEVVLKDTFSDSRYERHLMVTSILDVLKVNVLVYDLTGKPNNEKLFVYPGPPPEMLAVTYEDELRLNLVRANAAGNLEALKVILLDTSPRLLEQAVVELLSIPNLGLAFIEKRVISLVKGKLPGDIPIRIRHGPEDGLCQDEINARTQRFAQVRKALNIPDDSIQPPCIAIASSGGGMRAMVSAAGFYAALKAMKVLDAATYVASLSGSTWTASKWMNVSPNPWAKYTNQPPSLPDCWSSDVPPEDQENLDVSSLIKVATKSIWPNAGESIGKIILKFSIMAGYSCMLAHKMEVEDLFTLKTSPASTGLVPIPIYTACFPDTPKSFQWQEFTPYEIGGTFLQTFFSIDHLTIEDAGGTPPYLHDLMAVWGSAYNATFVQIMQNFNINVPDWLQYVLGNSSLPGSGMVNPNYNRVDPSTGKPLPLANHKKVFFCGMVAYLLIFHCRHYCVLSELWISL